jgi:hypothetical protein
VLPPHALQDIAQGLVWAQIGPDLFRAEAVAMRSQQRQNALPHRTSSLRRALASDLCRDRWFL